MTRCHVPTPLSEFDMMVIRAGGHTANELESMALNGFGMRCKRCGILADTLYRIVLTLEAGTHRSDAASHRRLSPKLTT